jgi:hypothetical protein
MEAHNRCASRPDGLQGQCKKCEKAHRDKPENKEKQKARNAAYHAEPENKEKAKAYNDAYRTKPENKENKKAYNAEYYAKPENKEKKKARDTKPENKERVKAYNAKPETKKKRNAWLKERRKNDPVFQARDCLRTLLYEFLNGTSKCERTRELLGCSFDQFVEYQLAIASPEVLAAKARGEKIDHDHNIPLAVKGIDPRIESHRRAMCHYTNFFWLEHLVNGRKHNHTPKGFNLAAWLKEQTARIAACEGKTPMETIEQNREHIDAAHAFADRFRI